MNNSKYNTFLLSILLSTLSAFFLIDYSADGTTYLENFNSTLDAENYDTFEFLFWGWFEYAIKLGFSSKFALFCLFLVVIFTKLKALAIFSKQSVILISIIYIALFYLLHEGTQLRIASGLAFALWSCVFMLRRRWILAVIMCFIAAGFHITSPLLPLIYLGCTLSPKVRNFSLILLLFSIYMYTYNISVISQIASPVTNFFGGRYTDYTNLLLEQGQNTTGLAFVYAFSLAGLIIFLKFWGYYNLNKIPNTFAPLLATSTYGTALFFFLHETIAIASRLSDILVITIVPLIGIFVGTLKPIYKLIFFVFLLLAFIVRLYQLFPLLLM